MKRERLVALNPRMYGHVFVAQEEEPISDSDEEEHLTRVEKHDLTLKVQLLQKKKSDSLLKFC